MCIYRQPTPGPSQGGRINRLETPVGVQLGVQVGVQEGVQVGVQEGVHVAAVADPGGRLPLVGVGKKWIKTALVP